jgi:hypothetical protein
MTGDIIAEVVDAVAAERGVDPADLDFVLYDYVDPAALERLAEHDGGAWTLTFRLREFEVTVTDAGEVTVGTADWELRP